MRLPQCGSAFMPAYGGFFCGAAGAWAGKGMHEGALAIPIDANEGLSDRPAQWLAAHAEMMDRDMKVAEENRRAPPSSPAVLARTSREQGPRNANIKDA